MDYIPSDYFQMPSPMIKIKSSDGEIFQVEVKVAQRFLLIKEMLDDLGVEENEVIGIPANGPKITGATLGKLIQWANHHKDDPTVADDDEKQSKPMDDISSWDAEFLRVDQSTLFQMIRAANYLNIKGLLDVTCKKVAKMIKGMDLDEARQELKILNDFSPDERKQVDKENKWYDGNSFWEPDRSKDGSLMDEIPAVSVQFDYFMQDLDNEVVEDCLKNSVIVREVLKHFSNPQLLKLSTMNKLWSYEARLLMRERGNVMAELWCHRTHQFQQVFEAFAADLQQMNVVPYSGMDLVINTESYAAGTETLDPIHEVILARLPLKRFSLWLRGNWLDYKDSPALLLLKKLLQDFSEVLQELSLEILEKQKEFIEHFVQQCSFSGLKVLKVGDSNDPETSGDSYTNYMKALVARAPKLQELHTEGKISLMENVLEGSEAVLIPQHSVPLNKISESFIGKLGLKDVELFYTGPEFDLDRFNRIAPMFLQAPCNTTLEKMNVDGLLAVPLMCWGISWESVNDLSMTFNISKSFDRRLLAILKDLDFTRMFPNLDKVRIYYTYARDQPSQNHMIATMEQANALLREPLPTQAANIKKLNLEQESISPAMVQLIAEMFPTIQKLEIETRTSLLQEILSPSREITFRSIWKHWSDLTEIEVKGTGLMVPSTGNLDSVFCGIFPEEVAQLRLKDEDFLKAVHIVPVMPAIMCLKNLKTLILELNKCSNEPYVDDGTFIFSKVTELVAFGRFRSLEVYLDLYTRGSPPVSHLKSFASVECFDYQLCRLPRIRMRMANLRVNRRHGNGL